MTAQTDTKLPAWPDVPVDPYRNEHVVLLCYERARADAAMARLRVAVEALAKIGDESAQDGVCDTWHADAANEALRLIGPLPTPLPGEGE